MATRNQVLSMFGATPEQVMERQRQAQAEFMAAQQDPFGQAGAAIGVGLGRLFGGKSEELQRAEQLQQTLQGLDMTDPDQMTQAASVLNQAGFSNEAMQLLARADEFRTSAQDRATSAARQQAAETEMRRGQFERGVTTQSVDVTVGDQTFSVPVQVETKINRDTQDVTVTTTEEQMQARARQVAQKLSREQDADKRAKIIDDIKFQNARNEADLIKKQMAAADRKANETTGLAWVPFERVEVDPDTGGVKKVTGHEYKAVTGRMVKGEDGKTSFVPNLQGLPEGTKVVDDKSGIPEGFQEFDNTKEVQYKLNGVPVIKVGGKAFKAHTIQGKIYYDPSKPIDAEKLRQQTQAELAEAQAQQQQPAATVGTRIANRVTQRPTQTEADRTVGLIKQITGQ